MKKYIPYFILVFAIAAIFIFEQSDSSTDSPEQSEKSSADSLSDQKQPAGKDIYGIDTTKYDRITDTVQTNEMLAGILGSRGVDFLTIDKIAKDKQDIFDVRKIRAGNPYRLYLNDTGAVKYFIYDINKIDYVFYDLTDSVFAELKKKETDTTEKSATGIINNSLWVSMQNSGLNPMLAFELSEIFAWTVDFFGIQPGDYYKVYYDELYVGNESAGIGKIKAALFNHNGKNYYAFPLDNGGTTEYFDEKGNSLKRQFLKAPLRFSRISSGFSNSRLHPILKIRRPHYGIDYAASVGTPVHSVGDGKIISAGRAGGAGKIIKIKHSGSFVTSYMHLSRFAKGIRNGAAVRQGQVIGYVGSTGLSTGPHLDFRVYMSGRPINPLKLESPPLEPVSPEKMPEFLKYSEKLLKRLDSLKLPEPDKKLPA